MIPTRDRMLLDSEVLEVVRLFREESLGRFRIAHIMGVPDYIIKNIIEGRSYYRITGGPLRRDDPEASRWRGGPKSYASMESRK